MAVSYFSLEWLMRQIVHARKEVPVPVLTGKTLRQAIDILSREGLALAKESEEFTSSIPAGSIIKQYPLAGTKVREGKIVRVVFSVGTEKIVVPELIGLPLRKAEIEIRAAGMALGETNEIHSLRQLKGYVLDQEPKPLALAEKGSLIHLTISLGEPGPDKIIVPDFTGKDQETALAWGSENGLSVKITETWDPAASRDRGIVAQNLKPDSILDREQIEIRPASLEITVARNPNMAAGRRFEYTLPARPVRIREVSIKSIAGSGEEREIYRGRNKPGEKIQIPVADSSGAKLRLRIYLDGVFMEERSFP